MIFYIHSLTNQPFSICKGIHATGNGKHQKLSLARVSSIEPTIKRHFQQIYTQPIKFHREIERERERERASHIGEAKGKTNLK